MEQIIKSKTAYLPDSSRTDGFPVENRFKILRRQEESKEEDSNTKDQGATVTTGIELT